MRFGIDWASLIVGSKFTVFGLFYFVFEGLFSEFYGIWYGVKGHRLESIWGNSDYLPSHPFHLHIKRHCR